MDNSLLDFDKKKRTYGFLADYEYFLESEKNIQGVLNLTEFQVEVTFQIFCLKMSFEFLES